MKTISPDIFLRIERALCIEFGVVIAYKGGPAASFIGAGFDIARAFGVPVPSGADFNSTYSTALPLVPVRGLPTVLLVRGNDTPLATLEALTELVHEATHGEQYREQPAWPGLYVSQPEYRAGVEASAYAAGASVHWAVTGELPSFDGTRHVLTNGYALGPDDAQLAAEMLGPMYAEIEEGVIRFEPARRAIRALDASGLLDPRARREIELSTAGVIA